MISPEDTAKTRATLLASVRRSAERGETWTEAETDAAHLARVLPHPEHQYAIRAEMMQAWFEAHQEADGHCTCNDCMEDFSAKQEQAIASD